MASPSLFAGRRRTVAVTVGAIVGYAVLACAAFAPTWPWDRGRLPNGPLGDPLQMVWFLAWTPYALLHGHDPFFTTALDYPGGVSLAANTSVPLLGVLAAPITLTLGPVTAYNLLLRVAIVASAGAMYGVLGRWCRSRLARFVGGLCYGFGPYVATHLRTEGHLDLVFLPIPPLLAWLVDAACLDAERPPARLGVAIGVLCAAQLAIAPEVLSDTVLVGVTVLLAAAAVTHPRATRDHLRRIVVVTTAGVASFVVLGGWQITEMIAGRGHLSGPVSSVAHLQSFHLDLLSPVLPSAHELIAPTGAVRAAATVARTVTRAGGSAELGGYLGIPLVLVCLLGVALLRRSRAVWVFAGIAAVAFVGTLGGDLGVDGHRTGLPLPEGVLGHLPLLKSTVPARFSALVMLGVAALLALVVDAALSRARAVGHRPRRAAVRAGVVVALGIVLLPLVPSGSFVRERPAVAPGIATALDGAIAPGTVVLAYPFPDPPYTEAMAWQALAGIRFRMIGGYATVRGTRGSGEIFAPLLTPPGVEEFLAVSEAGRARHYPAAPPPSLDDLCAFVRRHDVGAVLFSAFGPGSKAVELLFEKGFGPPVVRGTLEIFSPGGAGACGGG
jgi:hypothetical protein